MACVPDLAISLGPLLATIDTGAPPATATRPETAFADSVLRHEPAVRRLVHRLLGWPKTSADVDDVVQEVLLLAWQHRRRLRGEEHFGTWLVRIGINTTRNHQRKRALWQRLFGKHGGKRTGTHDDVLEPPAPPPSIDLDSRLAPVRTAMADLRHADRELLVLRYLEQRSIEQIALDLGVSRNAVDVRLTRARDRLRLLLPEARHD